MINDSSLNDEHLWGNLLWNHTLQENKAECIRKNKIKASSSGRKYMTASILRAAEQISTTATGRLNNGGLRGRLHLRLNDTKAINLYSSGACSVMPWDLFSFSFLWEKHKVSSSSQYTDTSMQCSIDFWKNNSKPNRRHGLRVYLPYLFCLLMFWHGTATKLKNRPPPVLPFSIMCFHFLPPLPSRLDDNMKAALSGQNAATRKLFPQMRLLSSKRQKTLLPSGPSSSVRYRGGSSEAFYEPTSRSSCPQYEYLPCAISSPRLGSRSAALAELSGQGFNSLWRCGPDRGFSESHC